ncbi:MAG: bacteriohemerythrin [Ignavibacteriales bacterium]|nr:bacteriohemerythrin [Ignavibacteriales bacterium]
MPLIEWDNAFSVGNREIDEHHKKFFHIINMLFDSMKTGEKEEILLPVLKELQQYVQYHFKAEESLMKMYAYPNISSHKAEHEDAIQKVNKFIIDYERKDDKLAIDVLNFLSNWLQNHILQTDRKYIPYLNKKI